MNARSYYSILFGLCLAFLSSSTLGSALPDPLGRISGMGNKPVSNVRLPTPFHFQNLPSTATSVAANDDFIKGRFNFRLAGRGISMNVPAVVGYSRAAAVAAFRGCLATGPYCFAGAALGVGVGVGIEYFLTSQGYSVDNSGFIISDSSTDDVSPLPGSCIVGDWLSGCASTDGLVHDDNSALTFSSIIDYMKARAPGKPLIYPGECSYTIANGVTCTNNSDSWQLIQLSYPTRYTYRMWYTAFSVDENGLPISGILNRTRVGFSTQVFYDPDTPLSSLVNIIPSGESIDPSVLLDTLDFDLYEPDSSDFAILGDRLAQVPPATIEFEAFEPYTLPSTTEISYDALGEPITTTTTTTVTPTVVNNGAAAPRIEILTNTNTVVESPSGVISDTNTGTITRPDLDTGVNPDTGQPYPPAPNVDTAYDCWSFQFICDWFVWTQDVPDVSIDQLEPDFDDLKSEREIEYIHRSVNVGVPATCPTGNSLDLGYFGEYTVSYDSFCDLAVSAKPLFLTFMSLLSLFIVYRAFSS